MKKRIKRGFRRTTQDKGYSFVSTVCQRMKSDGRFETLLAHVNELDARNTAYQLSNANAVNGGKLLIRIKNADYLEVMNQMDTVADYLELLAQGDDLLILAAGFELAEEPKAINELTMPTGVKVINDPDRTGTVKVKWDTNKTTVTTALEYQNKGETAWNNGTYSTSSSAELTGIEAGTYIYVRIYGIGRKGLKTDPTEPVMVLVS
jgi:hypothetical protein